jgi:hypothetical protein
MAKFTISNIDKDNVTTPNGGRITLFSDSTNNDNPSVKYSDGTVVDLTRTGDVVTGGTYSSSGGTLTLNNSNGDNIVVSGVTSGVSSGSYVPSGSTITLNKDNGDTINITGITTSINENNYYFVDPINGDNNTAEKGNRLKPYATIAGAESDAVSGDTVFIAADIIEANCGKDGLTYVYGKGVVHDWPDTNGSISGENWNALYSDHDKGDINVTIVGGILRVGSEWFGNWRRSIVRTNNASTFNIIAAEKLDLYGNDGWMFNLVGSGSTVNASCIGDLYNAFEVIKVERPNCNVTLSVGGDIIGKVDSGYNLINMMSGTPNANGTPIIYNNHIRVDVAGKILCKGHYIGGQRRPIIVSQQDTTQLTNTIVVNCKEFEFYDDYPNLAGDEIGLVCGSAVVNSYISFNSDIVRIGHDVASMGGSFDGGRMGLWGYQNLNTNDTTDYKFEIDFDVRTVIMGNYHNLNYDRGRLNTNYTKNVPVVTLKDTTIITENDDVAGFNEWKIASFTYSDNDSFINTDTSTIVFNGLCRIIQSDDAISAGKNAIGYNQELSGQTAFIEGTLITNGSVKTTGFTNNFTNNTVADGIPNAIFNDTSILTNFDKYNKLQ